MPGSGSAVGRVIIASMALMIAPLDASSASDAIAGPSADARTV
jgi:hypothetical protein